MQAAAAAAADGQALVSLLALFAEQTIEKGVEKISRSPLSSLTILSPCRGVGWSSTAVLVVDFGLSLSFLRCL